MDKNILIVDDEEDILSLLADTISRWGYNPIIARDGEDALEKIQSLPIDLVLTDLKMPKLDGVRLLKKIKQADDRTEVILFTGYPAVESAVEAMKVGAFDYLIKPVDIEELRLKIERGLEHRNMDKNLSTLRTLNWAIIISIPLWLGMGIILARLLL